MSIILLGGCEKEPFLEYSTYKPVVYVPTAEDNIEKFPLKIIWYKRLHTVQSSAYHTASDAEVHIDETGLSVFYDYDEFSYWDLKNGDNLTNKSISIDYQYNLNYHSTLGSIITSHRKIISVDKYGSETLLYTAPDSIYIDFQTSLHGDDLYFLNDDYDEGTSELYKLNVQSKQCELVSAMDGVKLWGLGHRASISLPAFFTVSGEEYELNSYSKSHGFNNSITFSSCKKVSDGSILWEKENLSAVYQSNIIVHKGDIIINSSCKISLFTGDKVWEFQSGIPGKYSPDDIVMRGAKVWNDKLMFISNGRFRELDLNTGQISYSGPLIAAEDHHPAIVIANGIAYWSDWIGGKSFLMGMNVSDHTIVLKALNPHYGINPYGSNTLFLDGGLQVDISSNIGYISDGYFIYCMKLL